jgi:hypothetical protein
MNNQEVIKYPGKILQNRGILENYYNIYEDILASKVNVIKTGSKCSSTGKAQDMIEYP